MSGSVNKVAAAAAAALLVLVAASCIMVESTKTKPTSSEDCSRLSLDANEIEVSQKTCVKCCRKFRLSGSLFADDPEIICRCKELQGPIKCSFIKVPYQMMGKSREREKCRECCLELGMDSTVGLRSRACQCRGHASAGYDDLDDE